MKKNKAQLDLGIPPIRGSRTYLPEPDSIEGILWGKPRGLSELKESSRILMASHDGWKPITLVQVAPDEKTATVADENQNVLESNTTESFRIPKKAPNRELRMG